MPLDPAERAARNAAIRNRAIRDAEQYVRSRLWRLEEAAAAELGELYVAAYRALASELAGVWGRYVTGETWSARDTSFRLRTEQLLSAIADDVARLSDAVTAATLEAAIRGYGAGALGRAWVLDQGLRGASLAVVPILPVEAIRAAILAPYQGSTFLDRFADARAEFEQRIRKSMVESQILGEGIGAATRRLAVELGVAQRGKASLRGYASRLEMIARTEILRASNLGALAVYEANADVLSGWTWLATKDERTCPICGALDGQVFALGAPESPPAHPRCRCSAVPNLIDTALEAAIVGKRESYREWAARRGVSIVEDGGVLRFERRV